MEGVMETVLRRHDVLPGAVHAVPELPRAMFTRNDTSRVRSAHQRFKCCKVRRVDLFCAACGLDLDDVLLFSGQTKSSQSLSESSEKGRLRTPMSKVLATRASNGVQEHSRTPSLNLMNVTVFLCLLLWLKTSAVFDSVAHK